MYWTVVVASSPIPLNKPPAAAKMTDAVYQYVLDHNAEPEVWRCCLRDSNVAMVACNVELMHMEH